tara:strand:- start:932 stop:1150 length:219 start_codon:yes stop_codon:yes gene_type:complete
MVGLPPLFPVSTMNHTEIFFDTMDVVSDVEVDVDVDVEMGVEVGVDVEVFADFGAIMGLMSSRPRAAPPKCP